MKTFLRDILHYLINIHMDLASHPHLEIYHEDVTPIIYKHICTKLFIAVKFIISTCCEHLKCSYIGEQLKKIWYTHIMEYCPAVKQERRSLRADMA